MDAAGNLYGTDSGGSSRCFGCGSVWKLAPNTEGTWTHTVLYRFENDVYGDEAPGKVILDAAGNLYGTTIRGVKRTAGPCLSSHLMPTGLGQ